MVYGERDEVRREEFILRRVRAGRSRIPFGAGNFLWSKGWVRDIAVAVRLAVETGAGAGTALDIAERRTWTIEQWARQILAAASSDAELVRVPDAVLPADLALTAALSQHILVDSGRARELLGWTDTDPYEALRASVAWHLAHPPADDGDHRDDDRALSAA
jgi:nucleoside-diphosphate-sugar epimerase